MPSDHILQVIGPSKPGIQRDGTSFDSMAYVDGQWCRFDVHGRPKKIGGYKLIDTGTPAITRGMFEVRRQGSVDVYLGRSSSLNVVNITKGGIANAEIDRTPIGFQKSLFTQLLVLNPIATVFGSGLVTITVPSTVGLYNGQIVTIAGAVLTNAITAVELNISAPITIIDATHFSYQTAGTANATGSGGGAAVTYTIDLDENLWTFDTYTIPSVVFTFLIPTMDPLATTTGSAVIVVTVPSTANLRTGNSVTISGATGFNNITAPQLNIVATITVLTATTFSYVSNGVANATGAGGGAAVVYAPSISVTYIVAHAAPNADDINNNVETIIWWGDITATSPLVAIDATQQSCSGGIVVGYPYFFKYGNDGVVAWTDDPTNWSEAVTAAIAGSKIIKGYRTRGGGNSPAFLFWSLSSLIRASFVGGATVFNFDTIQDDMYTLAQNSIVSFGNVFWWISIDQFYTYTGVVKPLENDMNTNYFFDNINTPFANKIWGMVLPRYREVWWFYPKGEATECTDVIIYNYKFNAWYDSILSRTAGFPPGLYPYPLMADGNQIFNRETGKGNNYGIWQHEFGTDQTLFGQNLAINSYFDTNIITFFDNNAAEDRQMRTRRIEPDFNQTGEMNIIVNSRDFAAGPVTSSTPYPFLPDTNSITLSKVDMTNMGRLVNFRFISNISGGSYEAGKNLLNYAPGDYYP